MHDEHKCKHCGGDRELRNPTGQCDHLFWPDLLSDEAKRANGYVPRQITVWEMPESDDATPTDERPSESWCIQAG